MALFTALAIGAALVGGAVAVSNIAKAAKAAKQQVVAQNQALDYQKQQNDLSAMRQKRDAVRSARIAFASAQAAGANQNVSESSSAQGGQGSIQTQLQDNVSFLDQWNKFSDQASESLGRANLFGAKAAKASATASLGVSLFNAAGGFGAFSGGSGLFAGAKAAGGGAVNSSSTNTILNTTGA